MNRRVFIKNLSAGLLVLNSGEIFSAASAFDNAGKKKTVLRFAVASDGHYGQAGTAYKQFYSEAVNAINDFHRKEPLAFCMINGDIIHDDNKWFPDAKAALDKLSVKYYVTQGNHDHATATEWQAAWGMPVNYDIIFGKNIMLAGTSSNEKGEYLCPDLDWFAQKLEEHKRAKNIFIFVHINPVKQTKYGVDCPEFYALLSKYKNVKAVFNGHDHDEDQVKMKETIPFIFDAHFGGNWGTAYRGFRIVELKKDNSVFTYVMNPAEKINESNLLQNVTFRV